MGFVPRGIIPPIITPLTDDGEVNYPVLRQMVKEKMMLFVVLKFMNCQK